VLATPVLPAAPEPGQLLSVDAVPGRRPGRVVVEVTGVVDNFTTPLLELCLDSRLNQRGLRELVVDLERATFLGTAGVASLVRAHQRCRERGISLFVLRAGRRRLLDPVQLAELADVVSVDRVVGSRPKPAGRRAGAHTRPAQRRPRQGRRSQSGE